MDCGARQRAAWLPSSHARQRRVGNIARARVFGLDIDPCVRGWLDESGFCGRGLDGGEDSAAVFWHQKRDVGS
eukprot:49003-Chlamydomonas_euryale.AAC.1